MLRDPARGQAGTAARRPRFCCAETTCEAAMASSRQKRKVSRVMKEHKRGTLRSGSGRKVKNRKQAIAIAMSESGQSGKRKGGAKRKYGAKRKRK
jgi:hypothetical protein